MSSARGPWEVRNKTIIDTLRNGVLVSIMQHGLRKSIRRFRIANPGSGGRCVLLSRWVAGPHGKLFGYHTFSVCK
jgi:hypothetical protein